MIVALILLFIISVKAWAEGDDSMAWYVKFCIFIVVLVIFISKFSD